MNYPSFRLAPKPEKAPEPPPETLLEPKLIFVAVAWALEKQRRQSLTAAKQRARATLET